MSQIDTRSGLPILRRVSVSALAVTERHSKAQAMKAKILIVRLSLFNFKHLARPHDPYQKDGFLLLEQKAPGRHGPVRQALHDDFHQGVIEETPLGAHWTLTSEPLEASKTLKSHSKVIKNQSKVIKKSPKITKKSQTITNKS